MRTQRIYIIMGCTGLFSDWNQWTVIAYTNQTDARKHADAATIAAKRWEDKDKEEDHSRKYELPFPEANPFDPGMIMYDSTDYYILETELVLEN